MINSALFGYFFFVHFNYGVYAYSPFPLTHVWLKHDAKSFPLLVIRIPDVDSLYEGSSQYSVTLGPSTVALPVNCDTFKIERKTIKIKH